VPHSVTLAFIGSHASVPDVPLFSPPKGFMRVLAACCDLNHCFFFVHNLWGSEEIACSIYRNEPLIVADEFPGLFNVDSADPAAQKHPGRMKHARDRLAFKEVTNGELLGRFARYKVLGRECP
jgi:hypothetical protein